jgi:DNA-binding FadR family transcriptional regulator
MKNRTLGEQTAENLFNLIKQKGYSTGEKLPNEYELSSLLGVSRNTVREAIRMLASRNIVNIRQGAGTFMSQKQGVPDDPLGFSLVDDRRKLTADLLQIRCIIEPQIASLAAQNATPHDIENLDVACREVEKLIRNHQDFSKKDVGYHACIANCSHNNVMSKLIPVIHAGVTVFSRVMGEQEFDQTLKAHRKIFEAIHARKAVDAQQAMMFHLLYNQNRFFEESLRN